MSSRDVGSSADWSALFTDPVPETEILRALRAARFLEEEDTALANSIVPGAGEFLSSFHLRQLIRDDIDHEEIQLEIARQKKFISRLSEILPTVYVYLNCRRMTTQ